MAITSRELTQKDIGKINISSHKKTQQSMNLIENYWESLDFWVSWDKNDILIFQLPNNHKTIYIYIYI